MKDLKESVDLSKWHNDSEFARFVVNKLQEDTGILLWSIPESLAIKNQLQTVTKLNKEPSKVWNQDSHSATRLCNLQLIGVLLTKLHLLLQIGVTDDKLLLKHRNEIELDFIDCHQPLNLTLKALQSNCPDIEEAFRSFNCSAGWLNSARYLGRTFF